jgi:serine/threonine-protein kinase
VTAALSEGDKSRMGLLDKIHSLFQSEKVDIRDRFELLKAAVSGTMSTFYMARDRKTGRVVGLKIGDREKVAAFESRFKQLNKPCEGEIAVSLKHPNIVQTCEYGVTTAGEQYIVMEYLDGPGLHALIRNRDPVLEGNRADLIRQMAEALAAVHKAGYIHRDICPRNFICTPDAKSLKLIDFGLTLPATRSFMQPGNRTGTPLYMAPEIVRRRWTDHRLDIFSLGVTAYHLCALELPWPVGDASGQTALAHDTEAARSIFDYRPRLNRELASAILRCIASKPDHRPETVEHLLRQLRAVSGDDEP